MRQPGSFEEFFEREHHALFAALLLLTRQRQEAEEIMQDSFLKLWERWDHVRDLENPTGYLYRTAMNGYGVVHDGHPSPCGRRSASCPTKTRSRGSKRVSRSSGVWRP
jgi:hypothetical protein